MKKIFGLTAILFSMAFSQGVVTQLDKGSINYSDQTISAIGIGFVPQNAINAGQARRMALRIAKQDALRQLIEIVNGVEYVPSQPRPLFEDSFKIKSAVPFAWS